MQKIMEEWFGTNHFDKDYRAITDECGVYKILLKDGISRNTTLVYVGYSRKLKNRISRHELIKFLKITYKCADTYICVKYCIIPSGVGWVVQGENARILERKLIKENSPMYNTQSN